MLFRSVRAASADAVLSQCTEKFRSRSDVDADLGDLMQTNSGSRRNAAKKRTKDTFHKSSSQFAWLVTKFLLVGAHNPRF